MLWYKELLARMEAKSGKRCWFADQFGFNRTNVVNWTNGKNIPVVDRQRRLTEIIGVIDYPSIQNKAGVSQNEIDMGLMVALIVRDRIEKETGKSLVLDLRDIAELTGLTKERVRQLSAVGEQKIAKTLAKQTPGMLESIATPGQIAMARNLQPQRSKGNPGRALEKLRERGQEDGMDRRANHGSDRSVA